MWTRSPIRTRARAQKENRDRPSDLAEAGNRPVPPGNQDDECIAAGLALRDMNIPHSTTGSRKTRRQRLTDLPEVHSRTSRRTTVYVLVPEHPAPPLPPRVPPVSPTAHLVSVP